MQLRNVGIAAFGKQNPHSAQSDCVGYSDLRSLQPRTRQL